MNYQQLHAYITNVQAILNSMHLANPPGTHLKQLIGIKTLTDASIRKER